MKRASMIDDRLAGDLANNIRDKLRAYTSGVDQGRIRTIIAGEIDAIRKKAEEINHET